MGILAATRVSSQIEKMEPIGSFEPVSMEQPGFRPSSGAVLYVSPNTTEVENLIKTVVDLARIDPPGYKLFDSEKDAEDAYRYKSTSCYVYYYSLWLIVESISYCKNDKTCNKKLSVVILMKF